jgi:hypothetical protein
MITVQAVDPFFVAKGRSRRLWIVGAGPTLESCQGIQLGDLKRFKKDDIWALNAAIVPVSKALPKQRVGWFYRDLRLVSEVLPKLEGFRGHIFTHNRAWHRTAASIPVRSGVWDIRTWLFKKETLTHNRSVLEDALQVAWIGEYSEVILGNGTDFAVVNGQPYSSMLKWKECHFSGKSQEEGVKPLVAHANGLKSMLSNIPMLKSMKIRALSPYFPEGIVDRVSAEELMGLAHA